MKVMSSGSRVAVVENLETRAYAASHERVITVLEYESLQPVVHSTAIYNYASTGIRGGLPDVAVTVDANNIIPITGTPGDDSVRVRDVSRGVEVRTFGHQSYMFYRSNRYNTRSATTTIENIYLFHAADVKGMTFYGDIGADAIRTSSLRLVNVVPIGVESVVSERKYRKADAGKAPSDFS